MTQDMEGEEGGGITEESTQWAVDADGSVEEDVSMEGRIVEVHHVPLLGKHHGDGDITVLETSPDVVFAQPRKAAAWHPDTDRLRPGGGSTDRDSPQLFLVSSHPVIATALLAAAVATTAAWLTRRALGRRRAFALSLEKIESGLRRFSEDPVQDSRMREGSLSHREGEAERRLAELRKLIADALEADKGCPWEARGNSSRRLRECHKGLSERIVRVKRAAEELAVMREVQRLLGAIDNTNGGGGCQGGDELTSDGDLGLGTRLYTRVNALLAKRPSGGDGRSSATRCVYRAELRGMYDALAVKEHEAVDRLRNGLQRWDLDAVDMALAQLRLLELPDLVEYFQGKREYVRSKRWRLRDELKDAHAEAFRGQPTSRLRQACARAEVFSATAWPEYECAKELLKNSHMQELELQARRIKTVHGLVADVNCNVRVDSSCGPALLLMDLPEQDSGYTSRLAVTGGGDAAGVGRRLALDPAAEGAQSSDTAGILGRGGGGGGGVDFHDDGYSCPGEPVVDGILSSRAGTAGGDLGVGAFGDSGDDVGSWSAVGLQVREGPLHHWQARQMTPAMVRRSAEADFLKYLTDREEELRRACDADRREQERREDQEVYRQEYMARLDARNEQEEERLKIEQQRLQVDEESHRWEQEKHELDRDKTRLDGLWAEDGDFFWLLAAFDVLVASGTIVARKGFTLDPWAIWKAAYASLITDCLISGGGDGGAPGEIYSSSSIPSSSTAASVILQMSASGAATAAAAECPPPASFLGATSGGLPTDVGGLDVLQVCGPVAAGDESGGALWWVWSTAGSAAGTLGRACYASTSWLLGQTLGAVIPSIQCEALAVSLFALWIVSLVLALKVIGLLVDGPVGPSARLAVLGVWVWGWFHAWLLEAGRELLLFVAPVPLLVLVYGATLRFFEKHRRPGGFWWVRGWDVRPIVSRALPTLVFCIAAWLLGVIAPS